MSLSHSLMVFSVVLALVVMGGCATPKGAGEPSSGPPEDSAPTSSAPGSPAPSPSTPSPSSSSSGSAEPQAPAGGAQTPEERRAVIDRRLDDSLGTFDEELRKEQERVARERDARDAAAAASTSADSETTSEKNEGEAGSAETENPPPVASTDGKSTDKPTRPGDLKSDKDRGGANSGAASGSGATAQNIPDGSDDDIIARRLRKAAEQETDPELKEKLWKEYIEYKKNAGQG